MQQRISYSGIVSTCMFALMVVALPASAQNKNRLERTQQCLQEGDSEMTSRIAKWVVSHGVEKQNLTAWTTDEHRARARSEVYEFLKWKLGGPSAVCAQYISTGEGHFERAYGDEGAAALAGLDLPDGKGNKFAIPKNIAHKWTEEAVFAIVWGICTGWAAMPSGDQIQLGKNIRDRQAPWTKPPAPYVNNPSGRVTPRDPTQNPDKTDSPLHGDANAGPEDMKKCEHAARASGKGSADFVIKGDVGFDLPSTQPYDVRDKLLDVLIDSYRAHRLYDQARMLLARARTTYNLQTSGGVASAAVTPVSASVAAGGSAPIDYLASLLGWLIQTHGSSAPAIFGGTDEKLPEAAAAYMGVKFVVMLDEPQQPRRSTNTVSAYAIIPAALATPRVAAAVTALTKSNVAAGAEIAIKERTPFNGELVNALVAAYKGDTGGLKTGR